jgi:hypothetical protein
VESRVCGVGRVGEGAPDGAEFPESARPAVAHEEGDGVGARRAGVHEVDVDVLEARFEVRDGVHRGLDGRPVVGVQPGGVEVLGPGVGWAWGSVSRGFQLLWSSCSDSVSFSSAM